MVPRCAWWWPGTIEMTCGAIPYIDLRECDNAFYRYFSAYPEVGEEGLRPAG